jgi:hypothetical protein
MSRSVAGGHSAYRRSGADLGDESDSPWTRQDKKKSRLPIPPGRHMAAAQGCAPMPTELREFGLMLPRNMPSRRGDRGSCSGIMKSCSSGGCSRSGNTNSWSGNGGSCCGNMRSGSGDELPCSGSARSCCGDVRPGCGDVKPGCGDVKPGCGDGSPSSGNMRSCCRQSRVKSVDFEAT